MYNQFKKIIFFLLGIGFAYLLSTIRFEYLWFSQFNLESVIFTRIIIQIAGFIIAILVGSLFYKWQRDWLLKDQDKIDGDSYYLAKGGGYILFMILSYFIFSISLFSLLSLSYHSVLSPDLILSSDEIIKSDFKQYFLKYSLLTLPLLFLLRQKSIVLKIQSFGILITSILCLKSWPIWSLAFAVPDSLLIEPVLNTDISFSLVKYPAFTFLNLIISLNLLLSIGLAITRYSILYNRFSELSIPFFNSSQKRLLRYIFSILFINISSLLWISRHSLLWKSNDIFSGASWLDVHFNIPLRTISALVCLSISIILMAKAIYKVPTLKEFMFVPIVIIILMIETIFSPVLQWLLVRPRELSLEYKYIERAIESTRRAFQLDEIKTRLINPKSRISANDLVLGQSTLKNIRLWDSQPLLATNKQLQQLRLYYNFSNASVDRYSLNSNNDQRQQVFISARELDQANLPINSRSWLNKHFVYTHGYGFTISPVNTKAADGLPEYFISDLGKSTKIEGSTSLNLTKEQIIQSIPIGNAALYYGTVKAPFVVAPTKIEELDYTEGDQNIYNHYSGTGGISLSNITNRIISSFYLRDPRLLNTGSLTRDSKLLIRREIKKRVKTIAPFISLIGDPYLVSIKIDKKHPNYNSDQYQYWIVEGYTLSKTYPYSSPIDLGDLDARYIRNSVKVIVDAYNGDVNFYVNEVNDPIISGWKKIFPTLFKDISSMPINLRKHLKVPTDMFNYQVTQLLKYHVTDVRTFYNGDDIWQVPKELYGKLQVPVEPYHITAQLSPNNKSEFLLLQPLSPLARPNLAGWLTARNDNDNYGELVLLRFPSETTIFGPEQIQALINQDPKISQQFSLWDRAGSEVIQGNLLVLPLGESLLYVEPVYLQATAGGLPTLTRIVVSDGKRIFMEENLNDGILKLLDNNALK